MLAISMSARPAMGIFAEVLLDATPDPICVVDAHGVVVRINRRVTEVLGWTADELTGKPVEVLMPARYREAHVGHRHDFARTPRTRPMSATLELHALRRDGVEIPVEISLSPVELDGRAYVIASLRDISERFETNQRLHFLSTHDALTKLHNRFSFESELERLGRGRRFPISIVMIDLDGLKVTNDSLGHAFGDRLLQATADLLRATFRADDFVARMGGDEFAVLLVGGDPAGSELAINRLRQSCAAVDLDGVSLEMSIGYAVATSGERMAEALRDADLAMYGDKRARRARRITADPARDS